MSINNTQSQTTNNLDPLSNEISSAVKQLASMSINCMLDKLSNINYLYKEIIIDFKKKYKQKESKI
jgi:hypothetical protein